MTAYNNIKVTAVVVSYNREALLRECLDGLAQQSRPVDRLIVVDNASTDNALQVAQTHPSQPEVIALSRNYGGAGGFCAGLALALQQQSQGGAEQSTSNETAEAARNDDENRAAKATVTPGNDSAKPTQPVCANSPDGAEFVWLMDDDTIPTPTALERLLDAAAQCRKTNGEWPTVLGSKALWTDGREHLMNRPRPRTWIARGSKTLEATAPTEAPFQARSLSFVSCLLNASTMRSLRALPRAAYFLWNDDFEFTTRLLRGGIGYYVPASVVVHKTKVFGSSDADPGQRFYNEVRNKLWMMQFSREDFTGLEYAEFLLRTLRRWVLTYLRAHDRRVIRDCFRRGWHDGRATTPRSNAEILADEPTAAQAVREIER